MAIPIRTTITCPTCSAFEDVTIGDTSIGPAGRVSETPIYSLFASPLWTQTRRDGETYLSCTTCGKQDFITVAHQARTRPPIFKKRDQDT